jgi:ferredoxin-type protein NapG
MERRDFFRFTVKKARQVAVKGVDSRARKRASHWIRPPYAIDELEFLLACTRCAACIEACPHDVIFALPSRLGAEVVGTPAMDLLNKGCQLCHDWPCVTACEPKALQRDAENDSLPRLALAEIDTSRCLPYSGPECGACKDVCPVEQAMLWQMERPSISAEYCIGCALCRVACIVEPKAINLHSLYEEAAS